MPSQLSQAYDAFNDSVIESGDWEFPRVVRMEAFGECVQMEQAAKALLLAVETFKASINGMDHVGKIISDSAELANLIVDYEQDQIGHKAADVLRAAIAEPVGLTMAREVVGA